MYKIVLFRLGLGCIYITSLLFFFKFFICIKKSKVSRFMIDHLLERWIHFSIDR